jgi:predicted metalloprotease with PDZ domain
MMLDIRIHELSQNKKSLKSVLMELAQKYGPNKPFKDADLIPEIIAMTSPELKSFFADYIEGDKPMPLEEYFKKVGFFFKKNYTDEILTFGQLSVNLDADNNALFFTNVTREGNVFGAEEGDIIISINNISVMPESYEQAFGELQAANEKSVVEIKVKRKNEILTLRGTPKKETKEVKNYFRFVEKVDEATDARRKAVFGEKLFIFE